MINDRNLVINGRFKLNFYLSASKIPDTVGETYFTQLVIISLNIQIYMKKKLLFLRFKISRTFYNENTVFKGVFAKNETGG